MEDQVGLLKKQFYRGVHKTLLTSRDITHLVAASDVLA